MKRGGEVSVYSTKYVRSPIPEGGLEVPGEVTFTYEDDENSAKLNL